MRRRPIIGTLGNALAFLVVLTLPLFHASAQQWVLAVVVSITIYNGAAPRSVWAMFALLVSVEILYGYPLGVTTISFLIAILLFIAVRRFVVLPAWSAQEGWSVWDLLRSIIVSVFFYTITVMVSVGVDDLLYHTGFVGARLMLLWNRQEVLIALAIIGITTAVLRRMAVPFRQEIQYGV